MRAAIVSQPQSISVRELPDPEPSSGQVVVRVRACGVCGIDAHLADGEFLPVRYPIVPGHEFSGEIVELGPDVPGQWQLGDRVAVDPILSCGQCPKCCSGCATECEKRGAIGDSVNGAFAEYVAVPAANCYQLPDRMTWEQGAMVEPTSRALTAVRRLGIAAGQRALVVGASTTGLLLQQLLLLSGITVTIVDRDAARLDHAKYLGAHHVSAELADVTGEKFDAAIDCTGDPDVIEVAFEAVRADGRLLMFGTPHADARCQLSRFPFYEEEVRLNGSMAVLDDFGVATGLIASGSVRTDSLLSHAFPLARVGEALMLTSSGAGAKVQVLPDFEVLGPVRSGVVGWSHV
ncbi:alcohol dehydrogenase catalytic domain-containing protein [Saccharopolyspora phatthalungensis]|uniref:2-desacetyl-2-hydroxyethyl bacteriochlorophyllide A dehydrogenase n=1 Tax=Saccharopolyspora phatthalungensis TaxID=664693 RepID=A0A840Q117_9PSEU|nr:alcohol dehydrogenase catalytic domain-containing protein [Saccharopolyspora phatthalungensis]MBB5152488.1 2-desacetyl-2-hydroxyethyl bacteriochlorophyllide A dehydrogenase [Saccharopolyspora phatthalungensis]